MTKSGKSSSQSTLGRIGELATIMLAVLFAFGVLAGCLTALSGAPFYAGILSAVCIAMLVWVLLTLRRNRENRVLLHVQSAIGLSVPVPDYLRTAMSVEPRRVSRPMGNMVYLLEQGLSIADALDEVVPDLSVRERRLIQMAQRSNQLPAILGRLVRERSARPQFSARGMGMLRWYVPFVLSVIVVVTSMIVVSVFPKFEQILKDFGAAPGRFKWAYQFPRMLVNEYMWIPVLAIAMFFLISAMREVRRAVRPRRLGIPLASRLPLISRARASRALSDICWTLAIDIRAGIALPQTLHDLAQMPLEGSLSSKMGRWRDLLVAGASPADSAREAGLPGLLACILRTPGEGLSDSLEALAQHYDGRYLRLSAVLDALAVPVATLCCASLVLTVALSIFGPILQIIDRINEMGVHR